MSCAVEGALAPVPKLLFGPVPPAPGTLGAEPVPIRCLFPSGEGGCCLQSGESGAEKSSSFVRSPQSVSNSQALALNCRSGHPWASGVPEIRISQLQMGTELKLGITSDSREVGELEHQVINPLIQFIHFIP